LVTADQVSSIASAAHAGLKPPTSPERVEEKCRWTFEGQGTVTLWWVAHDTTPAFMVLSGVDFPALWFEYDTYKQLDVYPPAGGFHVQTSFDLPGQSNLDEKALAIAFFNAAKSRLP
jgi:hypothetical protein